jgi:uncharacterized protein (TIGR02996 family)
MRENPELVAALVREDDPATYAVYADWLEAQGDPRGVLMNLQLRGETRRTEALLREHRREWLGSLADAPPSQLKLEWGIGHLRSARVERREHDYTIAVVPQIVETLLGLPIARLLRELTVGRMVPGRNRYDAVLRAICAHRALPALRSISLGEYSHSQNFLDWTELPDCAPLWAVVPSLRELRLRAASMRLRAIDLPELRDFEVITNALEPGSLAAIAEARWPKIERLHLEQTTSEGGVDECTPLFAGSGVPELRHLRLTCFDLDHELARSLVDAPLIRQLTHLDLSFGTLDDEDADLFLAHRDVFAHLELLSLERNFLSEAAQRL